jgi:hypothetical protein
MISVSFFSGMVGKVGGKKAGTHLLGLREGKNGVIFPREVAKSLLGTRKMTRGASKILTPG